MTVDQRSPTIKDIARRAGVSVSTVHYALRRTRPISAATRARVLQAVADLDYQPHAGAATLPSGRTTRLAVVIAGIEPAFANTYFSDFIRGVAGEAEAHGYTVVLYTAYGKRVEAGWRPSHVFRRHEADGLVVMGTQLHEDHLRELADSGQPCVLVNREFPGVPSVMMNREHGAFLATSHLLTQRRRPVGLLGARFPGAVETDRRPELLGYRTALAAAGVRYDERLVDFIPVEQPADEPTAAVLRQLLSSSEWGDTVRAPGLVVFSYTLAPNICRTLQATGLRVPDELALVLGDAGAESSDGLEVAPTVVQAPKFEMGQRATALLLRMLRGEPLSAEERHQRVPMEVVVRWSCGARRRLA